MQPTLPTAALPPAALLDALILQVPATTHRAAVQALSPLTLGPGQAVFAAIDPIDLTRAFAGVPAILSPDARAARILRGMP